MKDRREAAKQLQLNFEGLADKEQASKDLLALTKDEHSEVRWRAVSTFGRAFKYVTDKEQASKDLLALTKDEHNKVRWRAASALGHAFKYVTYKEQAWKGLLALTKDEHSEVRWRAASAFGHAFQHITDKEQASKDLLALTKDEDRFVRWRAASALGHAFQHVTDKEQASKDLLALTKDEHNKVRWRAASVLGHAFKYVTDKKQASKDLLALTKDEHNNVRGTATTALGRAFQYVTDKKQASKDLLALTKDEHNNVRGTAASALGRAFQYVTDKEQASKDLLALTKNEDIFVRWVAVSVLGPAFQYVADKEQASKDLLALTKDEHSVVRSYAYHSLGKISILKATETKEENFKNELEKALEYFEKSAKEDRWNNPAKFCLPFYRSFHAITFKRDSSEAEVKRAIEDAKKAVGGSENKKKLLEAIENLSNALTKAQKLRSLGQMQDELNAYSRYCNRASELLGETEGDAPGATKLLKKGLPIINQHIKQILGEIQEKSRELCKDTLDTPFEEQGKKVNLAGQHLSNVRDPIGLEKSVENLHMALSILCESIHEDHKTEACKILAKVKNEQFVEDKLNLINLAVSNIRIPATTRKEPANKSQNLKIFVSSTVKDLKDLRNELYRHLKELGHTPLFSEMADFPINRHPDSMTNCLMVAEECDIFIVLLDKRAGLRYTEREASPYPDLFGLTISEAEYRCARKNGKPVCIFIRNEAESQSAIYRQSKKKGIKKDLKWYSETGVYEFFDYLMHEKPHIPWRYTFDSIEEIILPLNKVIEEVQSSQDLNFL